MDKKARLSRRHHQRRPIAIIGERVRPQRQRDKGAIGHLRHTTRFVA